MGFFKRKKTSSAKPSTEQMLTDITRGLQHAVSVTHEAAVQQYLSLIERFFDKDSAGKLHAKMAIIQMDEQHHMNVPLIALAQTGGLSLEQMQVKLAVKLTKQETKSLANNLNDTFQQTRSSFAVSVQANGNDNDHKSKNKKCMDIELTFKSCEPPEGVSVIIEEYTKLIQPIKSDVTNKNSNQETVENNESITPNKDKN